MSTGIVVRVIAPLVNTKLEDPAVVVVDDRANHAISLLSGHLGGANALTRSIAKRNCVYMGYSTHNVPSLSKTAIRSGGATKSGPVGSVTCLTNDMIFTLTGIARLTQFLKIDGFNKFLLKNRRSW